MGPIGFLSIEYYNDKGSSTKSDLMGILYKGNPVGRLPKENPGEGLCKGNPIGRLYTGNPIQFIKESIWASMRKSIGESVKESVS